MAPRLQAGGVAAVLRLRQGKRPDRLAPSQARQPARFLLLRAAAGDRVHDQSGLDVDEGGERRVDAAHLSQRQPEGNATEARTTVFAHGAPDDAERGQRGQELDWEGRRLPGLNGHRA